MGHPWYQSILDNRSEIRPIPTEITADLNKLEGVRAVIFDIYGTLVVSGSGDVGSADQEDRGTFISQAIAAAGIDCSAAREPSIEDLHNAIRSSNQARLSETCTKPEVEIVDVWRTTLFNCGVQNVPTQSLHRLAAEYESRANPTWPMPGAAELLAELHDRGIRLGIVSNAQGFTLPLIEEIAGSFGGDSLFDPNLCVFSYRYRHAKPDACLFNVLCDRLSSLQIDPGEAVYVGNDRLNDIWAASVAGLRTAWFVGDQRSCRSREGDMRMQGLAQDIVLTRLEELSRCV
ncbi:HAD family hydrolase [Stieleria sp. JC731]|uniref:HAD family hydrolase n=1 Tax=Pirellulaceae TaxID=2691357 RepID=UPI001E5F7379|nr:HAD family hydrolase [Stieleria sp. JC731]MCC9602645.1 HAD family hydrolase [Stieleria sp. JC731]